MCQSLFRVPQSIHDAQSLEHFPLARSSLAATSMEMKLGSIAILFVAVACGGSVSAPVTDEPAPVADATPAEDAGDDTFGECPDELPTAREYCNNIVAGCTYEILCPYPYEPAEVTATCTDWRWVISEPNCTKMPDGCPDSSPEPGTSCEKGHNCYYGEHGDGPGCGEYVEYSCVDGTWVASTHGSC